MEYDFELQETSIIEIVDAKTIINLIDSLYYSYQKILDVLREKNLFDFENTETSNSSNYEEEKQNLYDGCPEYGSNEYDNWMIERLKFGINYSFAAIEKENLLQNLNVDSFVKIIDNASGKTLNEKIILSIAKIQGFSDPLYQLLINLDKTNPPKNLTFKYYIKIKI